jgi:glucose/arabinose dehydrogenase
MGAYGFALHPAFNRPGSPNAGFAYVYYTHVDGERHFNRLVRFDLSLPTLEEREASRLVLMDLERLPSGMHNGGGMFFGPDGFLYLSLGDFMMPEDTQRIDERLIAGIFRIDVDQRGGDVSAPIKRQPKDGMTQNYYIPLDNPWVGEENALEEYWAHGFRNPWRMSMDPETGSVWLGDVGVNLFEEQNRVEKGDNGQWNYREGPADTGAEQRGPVVGREIEPIYHYKQTALARASVGGLVYRGPKHPELQGWYIFADNQAGTLHALDPEDPEGTARIIAQGGQFGQLGITGIQSDEKGEIYVTLLGAKDRPSGEIVRLVSADGDDAPAPAEGIPVASTDKAVETKYVSVCSRCHGKDGRGAPEMDLGEEAEERPDFTSAKWQERVTDGYIKRVIVEGGSAVGISEQMPPWEDFFDDKELEVLVDKLRAFKE